MALFPHLRTLPIFINTVTKSDMINLITCKSRFNFLDILYTVGYGTGRDTFNHNLKSTHGPRVAHDGSGALKAITKHHTEPNTITLLFCQQTRQKLCRHMFHHQYADLQFTLCVTSPRSLIPRRTPVCYFADTLFFSICEVSSEVWRGQVQ